MTDADAVPEFADDAPTQPFTIEFDRHGHLISVSPRRRDDRPTLEIHPALLALPGVSAVVLAEGVNAIGGEVHVEHGVVLVGSVDGGEEATGRLLARFAEGTRTGVQP